MFQLNAPVVIRVKVKEVRTNVASYSHTLLRIHVIGGQWAVRIAPPSLSPHHSGPTYKYFDKSLYIFLLSNFALFQNLYSLVTHGGTKQTMYELMVNL